MIKQIRLKMFLAFILFGLFGIGMPNPGCAGADSQASFEIDAGSSGSIGPLFGDTANPKFPVGNNVSWNDISSFDSPDAVWNTTANSFTSAVNTNIASSASKYAAINSLRFPGGCQADTYHWQYGVGTNRFQNINYFNAAPDGSNDFQSSFKKSNFGTDEFMLLAKRLGAAPLITVNTLTGTAQEAKDWVTYANVTKGYKIKYWEIGNEPYNVHGTFVQASGTPAVPNDGTPDPAVHKLVYKSAYRSGEEFGTVVKDFILAMKTADPTIKVGVPMVSPTAEYVLNFVTNPQDPNYVGPSHPLYFMKTWNKGMLTVLKNANVKPDFVSLHNAYLPGDSVLKGEYSFEEMLTAAFGLLNGKANFGSETSPYLFDWGVQGDFNLLPANLQSYFGANSIQTSVTEYNAFFGMSTKYWSYVPTVGSAVYLASTQNLFLRNKILMSNHWSLIGNWDFGLITINGAKAPSYYVNKLYKDYLGSGPVMKKVTFAKNPQLKIGKIGDLPPLEQIPALDVVATRNGSTGSYIYMVVVNRDLKNPVTAGISVKGLALRNSMTKTVLSNPDLKSKSFSCQPANCPSQTVKMDSSKASTTAAPSVITLTFEPGSITGIRLQKL